MIEEHQNLAYGVGGMTPEEFLDLSPDEFVPFIEARIKHNEEENRMRNERAGLIAAILQSGVPVYFPKKPTAHKPGEYFKRGKPAAVSQPDHERRNESIFAVMKAWCGVRS